MAHKLAHPKKHIEQSKKDKPRDKKSKNRDLG